MTAAHKLKNKMPELIPVLEKNAIAKKVTELARQISFDYKDADLVMIGVLKGAFVLMADLMREIDVPTLLIDFVCVESYGCRSQSSGCIRLLKDINVDISGKDILIIEDIYDSGLTLAYLRKHLESFQPRTVKICALIDKRERHQVDVPVDYVGHTIEKGFLVGYGLDHAEAYRNLPGIYLLEL
jgi:hypoxanthine phosphoribosyltransferase